MTVKQINPSEFGQAPAKPVLVVTLFRKFIVLPRPLALASMLFAALPALAGLPKFGPMPAVPARLGVDSVAMGDARSALAVQLDLPVTSGPFQPTWESIAQQYPGTPTWLREAKFGIATAIAFNIHQENPASTARAMAQSGCAISAIVPCPLHSKFGN